MRPMFGRSRAGLRAIGIARKCPRLRWQERAPGPAGSSPSADARFAPALGHGHVAEDGPPPPPRGQTLSCRARRARPTRTQLPTRRCHRRVHGRVVVAAIVIGGRTATTSRFSAPLPSPLLPEERRPVSWRGFRIRVRPPARRHWSSAPPPPPPPGAGPAAFGMEPWGPFGVQLGGRCDRASAGFRPTSSPAGACEKLRRRPAGRVRTTPIGREPAAGISRRTDRHTRRGRASDTASYLPAGRLDDVGFGACAWKSARRRGYIYLYVHMNVRTGRRTPSPPPPR